MAELREKLKKAAASPLLIACAVVLSAAWTAALVNVWLPGTLMTSFIRTVMEFFRVKAGVIRYGTLLNAGRTLLLLTALPLPAALWMIVRFLPRSRDKGVKIFRIGLTVLSVLLTAAALAAEAFVILEMIVALPLYKDYTVSLRLLPYFLLILFFYTLWLLYARSLKRVMMGLFCAVHGQGIFTCPLLPIVVSFSAVLPTALAAAAAPGGWAARAAWGLTALFFLLWGLWLCRLRAAEKSEGRKKEEHKNYMRTYRS